MGFTGFEQQALESYLKLARSRTPAYAPCATLDEAQFIIANGDRGGVLDLLGAAQRMGDSLVVGSQTRPGAAGWLERPIDPLHLFRALDDAVKRRSLAATAARANPRNMTMAELGNAWPEEEQRRAAFFSPAPAVARPPDVVARPATPRAAAQASPLPEAGNLRPEQRRPSAVPSNETLTALIVDTSDTSELAAALEAQNIKATSVAKPHHAFAMLDAFPFDLVAIDVDLGPQSDLDGLQVTQAIKRQQRAPGDFCPPILLMSAQPSALEQAQGMLAGGSYYLKKPVLADALSSALVHAGLRPVASTASNEAASKGAASKEA